MASPTILLVDDDVAVLASLSKLLNLFGYVVAGASNSQAAMDYVAGARNRFDVIIHGSCHARHRRHGIPDVGEEDLS